jgi:predicted amidohydrolase
MRIALVQLNASTSKDENIAKVVDYIKEASKHNAKLIVFPEFTMAYTPVEQSMEELYHIAESIDGNFVSTVRSKAKEYGISILVTIYEKGINSKKVYDTALLIDNNGNVSSVYRKLHLYDALGFKESDKLLAGDELAMPVRIDDIRAGMMICYDVRFPEMARILTLLGSELLLIPSAWVQGAMKLEHWQTMLKARAIENGCYVIAPDQVGNIYIGHSMAIDPFGRVLLEMDDRSEGLGLVDVSIDVVREVRAKLPLLINRRVDVYSRYKDIITIM